MRILIYTPQYMPATRYGGPVQSVHGLARELVALGHAVDVLTTDVDGAARLEVPLDRPVELDGVRVHYCPIAPPRRIYRSPAMAARAAALMPGVDVVHVNGVYLWPGLMLGRMARAAGKRLVISPRGMLMPDLVAGKSRLAKSLWIRLLERPNLARASALHLTSQVEAEGLAEIGLDLAPLAVIGNGVEPPAALPTPAQIAAVWGDVPEGRRVAFLARLDWAKGMDLAIEAARAHPDAVLRLAGHDQIGLRARLEPRLRRPDGTLCGAFIGPLDGAAKWAFLAGADVVMVPSIGESFGMSVAEAMAIGTPVIATERVGVADLLARIDPGLVVPRRQEALNAALAALLADPDRRARIGQASCALVAAQMSWRGIAARMADLYAGHASTAAVRPAEGRDKAGSAR